MQETTRTLPLTTSRTRILLLTFFAAITLGPLTMIHAQWLTGPLVNTMLLLTCALVGPTEAVILGLFPSAVALSSGLLPLPLAPMVPFIMIGNALYVAVFHAFFHGKRCRIDGTRTRTDGTRTRTDGTRIRADGTRNRIDGTRTRGGVRLGIGVVAASALKFLFLASAARLLMTNLLSGPVAAKAIAMMGIPQLFTALIGGIIALALLSFLPSGVRPDRQP